MNSFRRDQGHKYSMERQRESPLAKEGREGLKQRDGSQFQV